MSHSYVVDVKLWLVRYFSFLSVFSLNVSAFIFCSSFSGFLVLCSLPFLLLLPNRCLVQVVRLSLLSFFPSVSLVVVAFGELFALVLSTRLTFVLLVLCRFLLAFQWWFFGWRCLLIWLFIQIWQFFPSCLFCHVHFGISCLAVYSRFPF